MDKPPRNDFHKQLYDKNHRRIRYIAENALLDKSLVNAVVELTFITALHCLRETDPNPGAWLKNTAITIIKRCNKTGGIADA